MNASGVLQTVGQVAGVGGIALGVLLIIFRDVVRKNIFPNLAQVQAYRLMRLIIVLTFSIAALGIVAWVYVQPAPSGATRGVSFPTDNPQEAIQKHLKLIDEERYTDAYSELAQEAHKRIQQAFFLEAFVSQRKPRGKVLTRELHGFTTLQQLPDQTRGAFAVATYKAEFEGGGKYLEAVTTIAENGKWKVLFHQLGPCAPPHCVP